MSTDRELWKTMSASEIRALRKRESAEMDRKQKSSERTRKAVEAKVEQAAKRAEEKQKLNLRKVTGVAEVPEEIAEQFKKKLKKDKLSAKDVFDVAIYQYINDELRINKP